MNMNHFWAQLFLATYVIKLGVCLVSNSTPESLDFLEISVLSESCITIKISGIVKQNI